MSGGVYYCLLFINVIFSFMPQGLHMTSNFDVIKQWIESRKAIPAMETVEEKRMPVIAFGDLDDTGWQEVTIEVFFSLMLEHDLVFVFEDGRQDDPHARYFHFLRWEKYADDVSTGEPERTGKSDIVCECGRIIAQTAFS